MVFAAAWLVDVLSSHVVRPARRRIPEAASGRDFGGAARKGSLAQRLVPEEGSRMRFVWPWRRCDVRVARRPSTRRPVVLAPSQEAPKEPAAASVRRRGPAGLVLLRSRLWPSSSPFVGVWVDRGRSVLPLSSSFARRRKWPKKGRPCLF